jgi:hypothetical protein
MKKLVLLAGAALIATTGVALAQTATTTPTANAATARPDRNADITRQQVIERADQRFARLDLNRDGRFTPEEGQQLAEQRRTQRADRMFERLDLNRDGNITREEMGQARNQRAEQRGARRAEAGEHAERRGHHGRRFMRGHGRHGGFAMRGGERMFGEQGFVTAEQMRTRAVERFDRMDINRDGTLTAAERQQARQQMREQFRQNRQARQNDG